MGLYLCSYFYGDIEWHNREIQSPSLRPGFIYLRHENSFGVIDTNHEVSAKSPAYIYRGFMSREEHREKYILYSYRSNRKSIIVVWDWLPIRSCSPRDFGQPDFAHLHAEGLQARSFELTACHLNRISESIFSGLERQRRFEFTLEHVSTSSGDCSWDVVLNLRD